MFEKKYFRMGVGVKQKKLLSSSISILILHRVSLVNFSQYIVRFACCLMVFFLGFSQEGEETGVELTPEQQRQLAMIDSMPYTVECDISSEDWLTKTPEEKERLLGKILFPILISNPI